MRKGSSLLLAFFFSVVFLLHGSIVFAAEPVVEVTILHTNDMHGRILPEDDGGASAGMPEISAAAKVLRRQNPNTLLVDAGDTLHGMPNINISKGENMVRIMNETGYDAFVPGNHDYNYGSEKLQALVKNMKFPVLSANAVDKKNGKLLFQAYKTVNLSGVKIAIFGITTPEKAVPSCVTQVRFLDVIKSSRRMVKLLRKDNDVVIGLMHVGVDKNCSVVTSDQIAKAVPGIDLIIDGHSHTELPQGMQVGNTLIAQTGSYDHRLGFVTLTISGHQILSKTAKLLTPEDLKKIAPEPDPAIVKVVADIQERNKPLFDTVVAHSPVALSSERGLVCTRETELGNLSADAMRWGTGADVAVVNSGNICSDLRVGEVRKKDVIAIFPFGNTLTKVQVSGALLKAVLEHSAAKYPAAFSGFLQVSGLQFSFDPARPEGHRVVEVMVGGQPLDLQKNYTLAITDFLYIGGDDYRMLENTKIVGEYGTYEEVFAAYLNQVGAKNPGIQGRIRQVQATAAAKAA